ncbi:MAG: response regulator [Candidatus Omnitrophica bacterium]|nr:response regulator [Candidatus Omnitrophota bacterium]
MKSILIVDDEPAMHEIYRDVFRDFSDRYRIEIQNNGLVALEKLKEKKFDLVILDIIMEPMPGDSFLVCLRNDKKTKSLPVIVVSVLGPSALRDLAKKTHNVQIVHKPFKKEVLLKSIDTMLK